MKLLQKWKQTALHNKALVLTSVIVAFGTLFYAGAAIFQVWLMNRSAQQSTAQVERLVGAVNASIGKAVDQERESVQNTLRQNREALDASISEAKRSLDAGVAQGKAALDASIEASRTDQRAWLSLDALQITTLTAGQPLVTEATNYNRGKTPALDVELGGWMQTSRVPFDDKALKETGSPFLLQEGALFPNTPYYLPFKTNTSLDAGQVQSVIDATLFVYVLVDIRYLDIFNRMHTLKACGRYVPATKRFEHCKGYKNVAN